ncbi:hypothetical protein TSUD_324490 [Trifolium subterraneum]|uniref:Uncharacterized protein n=1 Tax=Trifolium subterraneum TaxID=3900 RepID=A0A2Z6NCA7_TRISU|nr:hypothetical protein TSUD_324490 [Trifolium subterraneum]
MGDGNTITSSTMRVTNHVTKQSMMVSRVNLLADGILTCTTGTVQGITMIRDMLGWVGTAFVRMTEREVFCVVSREEFCVIRMVLNSVFMAGQQARCKVWSESKDGRRGGRLLVDVKEREERTKMTSKFHISGEKSYQNGGVVASERAGLTTKEHNGTEMNSLQKGVGSGGGGRGKFR